MCIERCLHGSGGSGPERDCLPHDLDIQVAKLKLLQSNFQSLKYDMEDKVIGYYPRKIAEAQMFIDGFSADLPILNAHPVKDDAFSMTVMGNTFMDRKEAGQAIINAVRLMSDPTKPMDLGEYRGFPMQARLDGEKFKVSLKQNLTYSAELGDDPVGNVTRINNALEQIPKNLAGNQAMLETLQRDLESAKIEAAKPFPQEAELAEKSARLSQLNAELDNEEKGRSKDSQEQDEEEPGPDDLEVDNAPPVKPSIREQLRAFTPPPRVACASERAYRGEVRA